VEKEVRVESVKAFQTKSGNTRYVLRDDEGNEYTTFKEDIARQAVTAEGKRARIEYHEQQRGEFLNVYLDRVEPLEEGDVEGDERAPEEAGTRQSRPPLGSSERRSPTSRWRRTSCSRS
jgi:hypothetical protein